MCIPIFFVCGDQEFVKDLGQATHCVNCQNPVRAAAARLPLLSTAPAGAAGRGRHPPMKYPALPCLGTASAVARGARPPLLCAARSCGGPECLCVSPLPLLSAEQRKAVRVIPPLPLLVRRRGGGAQPWWLLSVDRLALAAINAADESYGACSAGRADPWAAVAYQRLAFGGGS